jgi:hypothetical protein
VPHQLNNEPVTNTDQPRIIDVEGLQRAGFAAVCYASGDQIFYRRDTPVCSMPYLGRQIYGDSIYEDSVVITEVSALGLVTVRIDSTGYSEEPVSIDSDEAQAALRDSVAGTLDPRALDSLRVEPLHLQ